MLNISKKYPEVENIQEDISALKVDTVELARHVKEDGEKQVGIMGVKARKFANDLKAEGLREFSKVEKHVQENPAQSIAIAFAVGLVASYMLKRR